MRKFFSLFFTLILLTCSFAAAQDAKGTYLRVANFWSDETPVDVYLDTILIAESLRYGENAAYLPLSAGTHNITFTTTGTSDAPLAPLDITTADGHGYTLALTGQTARQAILIDETAAFIEASVRTGSVVLFLNATEASMSAQVGGDTIANEMPPNNYSVADLRTDATSIAIRYGGCGDDFALDTRLNTYTLLAVTRLEGETEIAGCAADLGVIQLNYSSLNAADFLRSLGMGGANGVNLALAAFENASLIDELSGTMPLTVFVPVNAAVDAVAEETLDAWLESRILLENVMGFHVIQGEVPLADVAHDLPIGGVTALTTLQGSGLPITLAEDGTTLLIGNIAHMIGSAYRVSNGMIYLIDTLLQPAELPEVTVLP